MVVLESCAADVVGSSESELLESDDEQAEPTSNKHRTAATDMRVLTPRCVASLARLVPMTDLTVNRMGWIIADPHRQRPCSDDTVRLCSVGAHECALRR
jgi:hypothetical protein